MKKVLPIQKGVLALLLALFLGMGTAYAYDFSVVVSGKTFYFNLIDATHHYVEVTYPGTYSNPYGGFTKPTGNISIPDGFYSGSTLYTVTKIGDMAFYGCSGLTGSLTIPSTVNSIGVDAFYNCSGFSGSLSVPNSVTTIGSWAFSNCGFTGSLTIGNGVTVIGAYAFYQCVSFTGSLTLGSSVTSIGQYAFQNCAGFTGSLTIPSSVTTIGNNAFQNCFGFTGTLTLGSSLTSIGDKAFYNCNKFTGSLTIPSSVTTIGESAFYNCRGFTGSLSIPNSVTTIGSEAFYYCNGFTGILTIGTGVTSIGASAFKNCTGFTQVKYNAINCANLTSDTKPFEGCTATTLTIGSGVQRIPAYMFYECSNFTGTLTIPNSVTTIGNGAFFECYGFTGSLTIPNSVTTIGVSAFGVCTGITGTLTLGNSVTTISPLAFQGCGFTGTLTIPSSVTALYFYAFQYCQNFTQINYNAVNCADVTSTPFNGCSATTLTIGSGVQRIPAKMFEECSNFTGTLTIPTSVTEIGASAFKNCTGFTQVKFNAVNCQDLEDEYVKPFEGCTATTLTIGSSVQRIPAYMFYQCTNFTGSLNIPNSVAEIGDYAFYTNGFNGSLTLGSSLTTIGQSAFFGCVNFTSSLTIPNSVTTMGDGAFAFCRNFTGLSLGSSLTSIGDVVFTLCTSFTGSLTIPNSVTTIGVGAFNSCTGFTGSLTIGNNVTTIGEQAFQNCGFTGALTIGSDVTSIAQDAFSYCTGFTSITALPETPPTLGEDAFEDVPTSIPVYVPCPSLEDYQSAYGWSNFTDIQCRESLTIYDGTTTNDHIPAYIFYFDDFTRSQFIIPKADLVDLIDSSISSMTFYTTSSNIPYTTVSSADVYLRVVNHSSISAYDLLGDICYSGTFSIASTDNGGEMTINFSTPFKYYGGNLLVSIENTEDNGYRQINFYGQTVYGASISGSNGSSTGTIPANQQNFIPKTTFGYTPSECSRPINLTATDITFNSAELEWTGFEDSYNVRYRVAPPFFEDFEEEASVASAWSFISMNTANGIGAGNNAAGFHANAAHSGEYGFRFSSYSRKEDDETYDQYLVSPRLDVTGELSFYYKKYNTSAETLKVGYSTTTDDLSVFTWTDLTVTTSWQEYTLQLPSDAKYFAFHYYGDYKFFVYLDDITIGGNGIPMGDWVTVNNVAGTTTEITGLDPSTHYVWQVQGANTFCGPNGSTIWSRKATFTTECETFVVDANNTFFEDFEGEAFVPNCWDTYSTNSNQWTRNTNSNYVHSGSASAYSGYYGDNYLVMPDIELSSDAMEAKLTFWSYNTYPSDFTFGYNNVVLLDGDTETVLWSAETVSESWVETTVDLSAYLGQTISLAFKYTGNNGNGWYVDDVEVTVTNTYNFLTNGNWNNGSCWNTGTVPPASSDVIIQANVTVPAGYLAVANEVNLDGGSITVADGGQLKHNTLDLVVTMKKNIAGYDDANSQNNYYLLAVPFLSVQVPTAMTANPGSDFYRFDPSESGAEWRNHKQEPITFVQRRYGYLYANPESVELSLTGITLSVSNEFTMSYTVDYIEGSDSPYNGWALLGNPFTYNAYVYRFGSNNEFVPMPIMMYDEEGELQTIYGGPVAPMQGFFVHVTETTTVYFSGEGHINDYVDLGLPSGLLWATCNVGANAPEEYGDYFAWGETTPKDTYTWSTYQYCNGSYNTLTKYCNNSSYGYNGFTDNLTTLLPEDDAAAANWGGNWRMPTQEEFQELYNNTTVTWTQQNGVNGRLFTASNGNSLFLPAAGYRWNDELTNAGSNGNYWSSSLDTDGPDDAWYFNFYSNGTGASRYYRYLGRSVRAVREN